MHVPFMIQYIHIFVVVSSKESPRVDKNNNVYKLKQQIITIDQVWLDLRSIQIKFLQARLYL